MNKRFIAFTLAVLMFFGNVVNTYADNDLDVSSNDNYSVEYSYDDLTDVSDNHSFDNDISDNSVSSGDIDPFEGDEDESVVNEQIDDVSDSDQSADIDMYIFQPGGYISDDIFVESLDKYKNPITSSGSNNTLLFSNGLYAAASLESAYVTPDLPLTRSQSPYGTCWAHSSLALAEINLIKNGADSGINFSEAHLAYFTYNHGVDPLGGLHDEISTRLNSNLFMLGGNYWGAFIELAAGGGAVSEDSFPYEKAKAYMDNGIDPSEEYGNNVAVIRNAYIIDEVKNNEEDVKRLVKDYGAVGVSIRSDNKYFRSSTSPSADANFYNYEFRKNIDFTDHAVTIVGWDDSYSRYNFITTPSRDGAWLIRNSWESGRSFLSGNYTQNTYFWASYDSKDILCTKAYSFEFTEDDDKMYDNIYQYDSALGDLHLHNDSSNEIKAANIFETHASDNENELLKAVSFYTPSPYVTYTIDIYKDLKNANNPESGTRIKTLEGTTVYAGYYVIDIDDRIVLPEGTKYSVVLSLKRPGIESECPYISIEKDDSVNGLEGGYDSISDESAGQSFLYMGGSLWWDISNPELKDMLGAYDYGHLRVKAFTDNTKYEITYHSDYEITNPNNTSYSYGDDFALSDPDVPEGYKFLGWFLDSDYKTKITQIKNKSGDLDIYAQIVPVKYLIVYNSNSGTGNMANQQFVYNVSGKLSKNIFTKAGYSFVGWNTLVDGSGTSYADEETVINLTKIDNASIKLYAQWGLNHYTINLDVSGGDELTDTTVDISYNDNILESIPYIPTRRGYLFDGWYKPDNTKVGPSERYTYTADLNLYAGYVPRTIRVLYAESDDYDLNFSASNLSFGDPIGEMAIATYKGDDQKIFAGWYTDATGGIKITEDIRPGIDAPFDLIEDFDSPITLYPHWANSIKVVFKLNGGRYDNLYDVIYYPVYGTNLSDIITMADEIPNRANYDFMGWYDAIDSGNKIFDENLAVVSDRSVEDDLILYAHWKQKSDSAVYAPTADISDVEPIKENSYISLTSRSKGAIIRYWIDEGPESEEPEGLAAYKVYTGPILITGAVRLTAYAEIPGLDISEISTFNYTVTPNEWGDVAEEDRESYQEGIWHSEIGVRYYRGNPVKLYDLRVYDGNKLLKENIDYTLSYKNNAPKFKTSEEEEASVSIVLKGNYSGTITEKFIIAKGVKELKDINDCTIEVLSDLTFNGEAQHPIIVKDGDKILTEGDDYILSVSEFKDAKKYSVKVTGIDAQNKSDVSDCYYKGTTKKAYTVEIKPRNIADCDIISEESVFYQKGGAKPSVSIVYNESGYVFAEGTDYKLRYKENANVGSKVYVEILCKNNLKGSDIPGGDNLYFKVVGDVPSERLVMKANDKVYTGKENTYTTSVAIYDVNGKALTAKTDYDIDIDNDGYTYALDTYVDYKYKEGKTVKIENTLRKAGKTVEPGDILPVGTLIKVTAHCKGMYTGDISTTYRIIAGDISKASVSVLPQIYTGDPICPDKDSVIVKVGSVILNDYEYDILGYENNVNKGKAKITIGGKGNYGGTKTVTFDIAVKNSMFTIRYDGNGSTSGNMKNVSVKTNGNLPINVTLTKNAYKKNGYNFIGWNTKKDGSGDFYENAAKVSFDEAYAGKVVTLYAQWEIINYTITYHKNAGANNLYNVLTSYTAEDNISIYDPERDEWPVGYYFKGWYTDTSYKNKISVIRQGTTGDLDLYALWIPYTYTVNFVSFEGTGSMKSLSYSYNETYTLPQCTFKNTGKVFFGWSTKRDADRDDIEYSDKEKVSNIAHIGNGYSNSVTLYAIWEDTYKINLETGDDVLITDAGDLIKADSAENEYIYKYDLKKNYKLPIAEREGFTFAGWYKDPAYKTQLKTLSGKTGTDLTLYAKFTPLSYKVVFNGNGSKKGSMSAQTFTYDSDFTLKNNTFVKYGYEFVGWAKSADSTVAEYDDEINDLDWNAKSKTLTLYAVWSKCSYNVYFESNGSLLKETDTSGNELTDDNGNVKIVTGHYEYSEKSNSMIVNSVIILPQVERQNYIFGGWYLDPAFKNKVKIKEYEPHQGLIPEGKYGDITLYAKWTLDPAATEGFIINLDPNGGTVDTERLTYDYSETEAFDGLPVLVRDGFDFTGWYKDPSLKTLVDKSSKGLVIPKKSRGDLKLYAGWKGMDYTITYNSDLPDGKPAKPYVQKMIYGTSRALSKNTFKASGYRFKGWSLKPSDERTESDMIFTDAMKVDRVTETYSENVELHAVWERIDYSIKYVDPENAPNDNPVTYNVDDEIVFSELEKAGYTFCGWYTNAKFTGKPASISKGTTGDKTYYAKWIKNSQFR